MLRVLRVPAIVAGLALLILAALTASAVAPGNPAFQRTWERTDQPVSSGAVARTWIWGPEASSQVINEPYAQSPGGSRQVQYYDKSRMEINNPDGDPSTPFYVTNGLLVVELMTGKLQLGDNQFEQYDPAQVNVAGDPDDPLTYADLAPLRSAPAVPNGSTIVQRVDGNGQVSSDQSLSSQGVTAAFRLTVPGIDHQVASPFWTFLNSTGPVRINGQTTTQRLFDPWFYATGYPITEAYWAQVKIGGTLRLVLLQCFERRCLTYTPGNPAGFETEAGNVGLHYHYWRYVLIPGNGTPTATSTTTATATTTATVEPATEYEFVKAWGKAYDPNTQFLAVGSIATTNDRNIYALDYNNGHVYRFDENGVLIAQWGSNGVGVGQFDTPLGIAVDASGNVYVADTLNHRVQQFTANGEYIRQWPTTDPISVTALEPHSIAIGPNSLVYVGGYNENVSVVQIYDNVGAFLTQFGSRGAALGQFEVPTSLAFSGTQLYLLNQALTVGNNRVEVFTSTGSPIIRWGSTGSGDNQFLGPLGIALDGAGRIYVADAANERVTMHDTIGTYFGEFDTGFPSIIPYAVGTNIYGDLYIVDNGGRILNFDTVRDFQFSWSDGRRGAFVGPGGITDASDDTLLVVDGDGDRVLHFTREGIFLDEFGSTGAGPGEFNEPIGAAINSQGQIYVVDRANYRIQKFDPDGVYLSQWGSSGSGDGQFTNPIDIAFDADNNAYVTDHDADRIQKFTSEGSYIDQWGSSGTGEGQFDGMEGIAIYGDVVYVADTDNNRIQAFDLDGNFQFQWGSKGSGDGQFDEPTGIAVDAHGYVYVSEENNHRVQKFTPDGDFLAKWGGLGSANGKFNYPYALVVDADGNVYVTDWGNYRVQKFAPVE